MTDKLSDDNKALVEEKVNEAIAWIDNNRSAELDEIAHQQKEFREAVDPILAAGGSEKEEQPVGPNIEEVD
jgi:hypothetical protein